MNADNLTPVVPYPGAGTRRTFVSGDPDPTRLRISYFQRASDGALVVHAWFGPGCEGPPGFVHGGAVAAVMDDAMGAGVWLAGHTGVAARIIVDLREMVPVGFDGLVETRIEGIEGRKVSIRAWLLERGGSHRVFAESEGLFVILSTEQMQSIQAQARQAD
jgi:acyl-coenzyme A thioesterase PaaI-like protein